MNLPSEFFDVAYESTRIPGCLDQSNLRLGANCQVYAYEVLRYFKRFVPNDRSSELWEDESYSKAVENLEPLDLMLYNSTPESYGAHIGIYAGEGMVLHLSQYNGVPKYEKHRDLLKRKKYRYFIGAKRVEYRSA